MTRVWIAFLAAGLLLLPATAQAGVLQSRCLPGAAPVAGQPQGASQPAVADEHRESADPGRPMDQVGAADSVEFAYRPDDRVHVVYPPRSVNRNLDFWKIPWKYGEKVEGSITVETAGPLTGLSIRPVAGGVSVDGDASRQTIAPSAIKFGRVLREGETAATELPGGLYVFAFEITGIPGEDTYLIPLEAVYGPADQQVRQPLPSIKLKVFAEPQVQVSSGKQLTEQWVNPGAPVRMLGFLDSLLARDERAFWNTINPEAVVSITLPGRPRVQSSQTFRLNVTMGPVLDEANNEMPQVGFWIDGKARRHDTSGQMHRLEETSLSRYEGVLPPRTGQYLGVANETVHIRVYRLFCNDDGKVIAPRIPPGVYHSELRIETEWGTVTTLPVTLSVKDSPVWPVVTAIAGILLSLLSDYWQKRQPLYRAQVRGRRWRHIYVATRQQIPLVEQAIARLNGAVTAGDAAQAGQAAGLLESLVRSLPETQMLQAAVEALADLPVSPVQVRETVLGAASVSDAFQRLKEFVAGHPNPAVQGFDLTAPRQWEPREFDPGPPSLGSPRSMLAGQVRQWVERQWLFLRHPASPIAAPGLWDSVAMALLFLLANGLLIAVQHTQTYAPNATWGEAGDYMNLLFLGYAGDTTRAKLMLLAGKTGPEKGGTPEPAGPAGPGTGQAPPESKGP